MLKNREAEFAGRPRFDYQLGLAALDSGAPGQAILALERVLAFDPGHLQARAEIGRAYLLTGERQSARRELEVVAAQRIPTEARQVIDGYLAGLAQAEAAASGRRSFHVEMAFGWDSNVNFGSSLTQWILADGTAVSPLPVNQRESSPFVGTTAGGFAVHPMGDGLEAVWGGTLSHRAHPSVHRLDQTSVDFAAGVQHRKGCHTSTMQALLQHLRLDQRGFRNAVGGLGQWRCDLDARTQAGAFVQVFGFRHPDESIRDARRFSTGATLARALPGAGSPIVIGHVYGGRERPVRDVPQLQFDFAGVRASVSLKLDPSWRASLSVSHERRTFAGAEPLFGATRRDRQTDLRIVAEKEVSKEWVLSPQLTLTRNASTLAPNDFNRVQAAVVARYRF